MKLKSSTVALVAIALVSAGGIYLWERSNSQQTLDKKTLGDNKSAQPLFKFKEADITQITIQTKNQTLALKKAAKGWQLTQPKPGPADEGTVAFLLNLLVTATPERTFAIKPGQLQEFGLDQPTATLSLQLKSQSAHQLLLGKQTFNQSAVYAQVDPTDAVSQKSVVLVPTGFLDAVNRPLKDWQAKTSPPKPSPPAPKP